MGENTLAFILIGGSVTAAIAILYLVFGRTDTSEEDRKIDITLAEETPPTISDPFPPLAKTRDERIGYYARNKDDLPVGILQPSTPITGTSVTKSTGSYADDLGGSSFSSSD